jgi:predicted TIM-barrel fold metal-dependent hydrolase
MAIHIHTMAGAGGYFHVAGANPLLLESVLNDPDLRKTNFVMLHGGWPFTREIGALLSKPNAYLDFSAQAFVTGGTSMAGWMREWLEALPEKVMFGTDAYPFMPEMGWEELGVIDAAKGRLALSIALTGMMRDGEISRARAGELARMVLRENARKLYGIEDVK